MRRQTILGVLLVAGFSFQAASAGPFPFSLDQRADHLIAISGGGTCVTTGSYDKDTFAWEQVQVCPTQPIELADGSLLQTVLSEESYLNASVNNDGEVLGGTYSWYGQIPELGITTRTLLGQGTLIDAAYTEIDGENSGPIFSALIEFDFIVDGLTDIGQLVEWVAYISPVWPGCDDSISLCESWTVSTEYGPSANYTGSNFFYLDRSIIPEPGTLALLAIGLAGMGLTRRGKTT